MMSINSISEIDQIFDRAISQYPHNSDLLKAFQPIIVAQRELACTAGPQLFNRPVDKDKLQAGVPVMSQIDSFALEAPWKEIVAALAAAIKKGLPSLAEQLDDIFVCVQKGSIHLDRYFHSSAGEANKLAEKWVKDLEISPGPLSLLLNAVKRVALERCARDIAASLGEFAWEKGYCPICGDFPSIALIEETGGKRFLHCSSCGHEWRFTRVVCPFCEIHAERGMPYYYIEGNPQESVFVCDKCKKYLVTLHRAGNLHARDLDVAALGLIHLDILMQDKGYEPMTATAWNALK